MSKYLNKIRRFGYKGFGVVTIGNLLLFVVSMCMLLTLTSAMNNKLSKINDYTLIVEKDFNIQSVSLTNNSVLKYVETDINNQLSNMMIDYKGEFGVADSLVDGVISEIGDEYKIITIRAEKILSETNRDQLKDNKAIISVSGDMYNANEVLELSFIGLVKIVCIVVLLLMLIVNSLAIGFYAKNQKGTNFDKRDSIMMSAIITMLIVLIGAYYLINAYNIHEWLFQSYREYSMIMLLGAIGVSLTFPLLIQLFSLRTKPESKNDEDKAG